MVITCVGIMIYIEICITTYYCIKVIFSSIAYGTPENSLSQPVHAVVGCAMKLSDLRGS